MAADFIRAKTFEDAYKASCRVSVNNARGSGTFIGKDAEKNRCIILTNYHVVTNNKVATLDFWTNGVRQSITGQVFAKFYDAKRPYDFALIAVDSDELAKINPPFVALAGHGVAPDNNSYILSSGCPKGRFAQAWKGKVLGYYNGSTVMFQPGPVPGQSGSGVLSEIDGDLWLTGVLTWLIGTEGADDSKGGAIPIANLYEALKGQQDASYNDFGSPIPPDAVECHMQSPYVVEFTQNNCTPCEKAKEEVDLLRQSGIVVETVNISESQDNLKRADALNIKGTPTFIVFSQDSAETARFEGTKKVKEIVAEVDRLIQQQKEDEEKLLLQNSIANSFESGNVTQELTNSLFAPRTNLPSPDIDKQSFRNRAPVYEYEYGNYENVGFFEDSNTRWLNRGQRTPTPQAPKIQERTGGNATTTPQLGLRVIDQFEKALNKVFEGQKERLIKTLNDLKYHFLSVVIILIVIGTLIAELIKHLVTKWIKKTKSYLDELSNTIADGNQDAESQTKPANKTTGTKSPKKK